MGGACRARASALGLSRDIGNRADSAASADIPGRLCWRPTIGPISAYALALPGFSRGRVLNELNQPLVSRMLLERREVRVALEP